MSWKTRRRGKGRQKGIHFRSKPTKPPRPVTKNPNLVDWSLKQSRFDETTVQYALVTAQGISTTKAHVHIAPDKSFAFIFSVRTKQGFQRKGWAGLLVDELEKELRKIGVKEIRGQFLKPADVSMFMRRGYIPTHSGSGYFYKGLA